MAESRSTGAATILAGIATLLVVVGVGTGVYALVGALLGNDEVAVHHDSGRRPRGAAPRLGPTPQLR